MILVLEFVLDIFLLPADVVIVPAELIGDALFFAVGIIGVMAGNRSSGRQIGASRPMLRSNRKGTLGLQHSRRAISGAGAGTVVGVWLLFAAVLGFQWWWSVHHPILQILTLPFELVFDLTAAMVSIVVTLAVLVGHRGSAPGREVGG